VLRLVRADLDLMDAALAGDDALARALGLEVVPGWVSFTEALQVAHTLPVRNASNRVLGRPALGSTERRGRTAGPSGAGALTRVDAEADRP
jgi:hypothetical protein